MSEMHSIELDPKTATPNEFTKRLSRAEQYLAMLDNIDDWVCLARNEVDTLISKAQETKDIKVFDEVLNAFESLRDLIEFDVEF